MQSHEDAQANDALDALRKRAEELTRLGENFITAGAPHERILAESNRRGFLIRQLPTDPFGLRISIGEVDQSSPLSRVDSLTPRYLVYRGDRQSIVGLLHRALAALLSDA